MTGQPTLEEVETETNGWRLVSMTYAFTLAAEWEGS